MDVENETKEIIGMLEELRRRIIRLRCEAGDTEVAVEELRQSVNGINEAQYWMSEFKGSRKHAEAGS